VPVSNCRISADVLCHFWGHYRETSVFLKPDFSIAYRPEGRRVEYVYSLIYNPYICKWEINQDHSDIEDYNPPKDDSIGKTHKEYVIDGWLRTGKVDRDHAEKLFKSSVSSLKRKAKRKLKEKSRIL